MPKHERDISDKCEHCGKTYCLDCVARVEVLDDVIENLKARLADSNLMVRAGLGEAVRLVVEMRGRVGK